jgi:hypothetical protein
MQGRIERKLPMHLSPRCGAYARTTSDACRNAAMANGRCRMHGGNSTGALKGNQNALVSGDHTEEAVEQRRQAAQHRLELRARLRVIRSSCSVFLRRRRTYKTRR